MRGGRGTTRSANLEKPWAAEIKAVESRRSRLRTVVDITKDLVP